MKSTQYLPALMIVISVVISIPFIFKGDYRMVIYWNCAAAIHWSVNF